MKRALLCSTLLLLAGLVTVPDASAFGWKDVLKLHRAGVADSLILQKIEYSGETIRLGADEIEALKEAGVSDTVISAMLRTEAEEYEEYDGRYDGDAYYYQSRPRLYVGFGWRAPYDWYYDRYYSYPRYRPYYVRDYYGYYGGHRNDTRYDRPHRRHYDGRGSYRDYGTSRERTRVERRIDSRSRWDGYRTRSHVGPRGDAPRAGRSGGSNRSGGGGVRTRHR